MRHSHHAPGTESGEATELELVFAMTRHCFAAVRHLDLIVK